MSDRRRLMIANQKKSNLFNLNRTFGVLNGGWGQSAIRDNLSDEHFYYYMSRNNYYSKVTEEDTAIKVDLEENSFQYFVNTTNYGVLFPVKVKPNKTYTISFETISGRIIVACAFFNSSGVYLIDHRGNLTFTTPENCAWAGIMLSNEDIGIENIAKIKNIQLKEIS